MVDVLLAAVAAFLVAVVTTPAGVSGAVVLLPVQASLLDVPNPALTPTNLLYNVIATPGALLRFRRRGRLRTPLARAMVLGAVPGVVLGAILRVELLPSRDAFLVVMALVLAPLGAVARCCGATGRPGGCARPRWRRLRLVTPLALAVGTVGGIYGIGGGSLLSPILVGLGWSIVEVAPAALLATFLTSVAGVLAFQGLELLRGDGAIAPEWTHRPGPGRRRRGRLVRRRLAPAPRAGGAAAARPRAGVRRAGRPLRAGIAGLAAGGAHRRGGPGGQQHHEHDRQPRGQRGAGRGEADDAGVERAARPRARRASAAARAP